METIIKIEEEKNNTERIEFKVTREMNYKYIAPIVKNLEWKLNNNWDDYNEVAHCCSLLEKYKSMEGAWIDIHIIEKNEIVIGCLFIVGGKADYSGYGVELEKNEECSMLNYFHISEEGRGMGTVWIKEIIIPYYKERGFKKIYIKSSHERAWSFYNRIGKTIGRYKTTSDNDIYNRDGKIFVVEI